MTKRLVRVQLVIKLSVDVDIDAWAAEYDVAATPTAVRKDVKNYYKSHQVVTEYHWDEGLILDANHR